MIPFDESAWWGDCANTWHEEEKQHVYAKRMGLVAQWGGAHPPSYDLANRSVIDIGGGPVSLLLKCLNRGRAVVADPAIFPQWVVDRYTQLGIEFWRQPGEELEGYSFDEAWIYNVLQHVWDPSLVIARARALAGTVRVFDWIGIDPYDGHPHRLEREQLDICLGAPGFTAKLDESGCVGEAYYGVFRGQS